MDYSTEMIEVDAEMVVEVRRTAEAAQERGLLAASQWALGILVSLPDDLRSVPIPPSPSVDETEAYLREEEVFELARQAVGDKQHRRASHLLRDCTSGKALFLRTYCSYIANEKDALREWHTHDGIRTQPPTPINTKLADLYELIQDTQDPWMLFLRALFLYRLSRQDDAIDCILSHLASVPWNWSAWALLGNCINDHQQFSDLLERLPLPMTHPVVYIFVVYTMNSLYTSTEAELDLCARLLLSFPQSLFIMGLRANAFYNLHKYPEAEAQFDVMLGIDQYRTDELEVLVHVLYAVENKERLSVLAQFHLVVNRDRPQVCFLLGCHHSLRSEHEKAVKYFRRATELDRTFSSAWTFMGTEFLDMANYHAAIESFRRAVDANPKDYRAWTGLGKAYVMMGMPLYGLHYQSRALHIRPDEAECWEDQANAQEALGKTDEAISSYRRALEANAPHPTKVFVRLSQLLSQVGDSSGALTYAQEAIRAAELNSQPVEQYAKALVAVAEFQLRQSTGDWKRARDYLERVLAHTSPSGDDSYHGKALELLKMAKTKLQMRGMMI